jgi:hypothetical protein
MMVLMMTMILMNEYADDDINDYDVDDDHVIYY